MHLSVIVSTYNAPAWLEKALWGYAGQRHRNFELLVADDGSTDETARLLRRYARRGLPIRHVRQADDGFRKSRILNRAIVAARADYLVFSDGDCIPRADFLTAHATLARPGRFLSGGYVKLPMAVSRAIARDDVTSGRAFSLPWIRARGVRGPRRLVKLGIAPRAAPAADLLTTTRATWNGHNASGWRRDILAANGFDERMQYGGEDRELGERLENAGIRGLQVRHRAVCVHLGHPRPYATAESIARNRRIRRTTRAQGILRTPFGIDQP
ncbi:MAG: glycosyltransferase [Gammaproteobacteria bacterium]|nr:glycosyltransferase [Gammaproteobacteria bacterium]